MVWDFDICCGVSSYDVVYRHMVWGFDIWCVVSAYGLGY